MTDRPGESMRPLDDPSWAFYSRTRLAIRGAGGSVEVALWEPLDAATREALRGLFITPAFGVVTPCNPRGVSIDDRENGRRVRRFMGTLRTEGLPFRIACGMSEDRTSHRERSFAIAAEADVCRVLALEAMQSAFFWFDGERFELRGALVEGGPWMLPI